MYFKLGCHVFSMWRVGLVNERVTGVHDTSCCISINPNSCVLAPVLHFSALLFGCSGDTAQRPPLTSQPQTIVSPLLLPRGAGQVVVTVVHFLCPVPSFFPNQDYQNIHPSSLSSPTAVESIERAHASSRLSI
jgi:hypothetical protein